MDISESTTRLFGDKDENQDEELLNQAIALPEANEEEELLRQAIALSLEV